MDMLTGVLGLPGSGKTLYLLWVIEQFVKARRFVATNIRLKSSCWFHKRVALLDESDGTGLSQWPVFQEPDPELKIPYKAFWHYVPRDAVLVIDELDNYFDSMDFAGLRKLSRETNWYWKQHRKFGHDVIYTVQNMGCLFNRVRLRTQEWVVCESDLRSMPRWALRFLPRSMLRFRRASFADKELRKRVADGHFSWAEAQRMFTWYDTEQLIGLSLVRKAG